MKNDWNCQLILFFFFSFGRKNKLSHKTNDLFFQDPDEFVSEQFLLRLSK